MKALILLAIFFAVVTYVENQPTFRYPWWDHLKAMRKDKKDAQ